MLNNAVGLGTGKREFQIVATRGFIPEEGVFCWDVRPPAFVPWLTKGGTEL